MRSIDDLRRHLVDAFGPDCERQYWDIFEQLRTELGYADYLGALQRYRVEHPRETALLGVSLFLLHYPFADRVYPRRARRRSRALQRRGPVVILSDGDVVFQPRKIERSGLWAAVARRGARSTCTRSRCSTTSSSAIRRQRYVMVDDKLRILAAMKAVWGDRLTTVFVRQGHYAADAALVASYPSPDMAIDRIGDSDNMSLP